MPYLVDGHNLIPKIPGLSLRSLDDELQLIQRLQEFYQRSGKQVEVFFDNAPAGQALSQSYGGVTAHFIRAGRTADAAIIARLRNMGRSAQNWTVVSSDRQIQAAARAAHAKVILSDEFARMLLDQPENGSALGQEADVYLSAAEVDEWLDLFGKGRDASDESS